MAEGAAETTASGPAAGPFAGVGRTVRVAVLLTGLLLGGAAAGYILLAAQRPPGEPSGMASPSPGPTATFPTAQELDLVESVSLPVREFCGRTNAEDERLGNVASVRCDLELAADADTVWFDQFATSQELATAFDEIFRRERPPYGEDCSPTVSRATGNWSAGATHSGSLMCYQVEGETWIVWTYRADRTLARAVREGTAPEDWTELYAWWDNIKLFQR